MKQNFKLFATLAASAAMMISCQQAEEPTMDKAQEPVVKTRAYGDKTPKVTIYVETNDVNPLNAGDYLLSDGSAYADIVEFFAANLNKETVNGVVRPTLYPVSYTHLDCIRDRYQAIGSQSGLPQYDLYSATNVRLQERALGYTCLLYTSFLRRANDFGRNRYDLSRTF